MGKKKVKARVVKCIARDQRNILEDKGVRSSAANAASVTR